MMTRRPARIALIALISAAFLVVTGCGDKEAVTTDAKTEGIWLDAGRLDYHIQGSRVLNPGITPDNAYLKGLPSNATAPTGRELWFAVFLRIENRTKQAALTARQFEIVDTQGNQFTPFLIKQSANPFAY